MVKAVPYALSRLLKVLTLDQVQGLPDMVFVCNSGIVRGNKVYLSRFRHKERTGEQEHYLKWFKQNGYETVGEDYPEYFEGNFFSLHGHLFLITCRWW